MTEEQLEAQRAALRDRHAAAAAALSEAADSARAALRGGAAELRAFVAPSSNGNGFGGIPMDDLPPYVPPADAFAENALIPDTPLLDGGAGAPAFDDSPLWQN